MKIQCNVLSNTIPVTNTSIYHRRCDWAAYVVAKFDMFSDNSLLSDMIWNHLKLFEILRNVLKFWAWCGMWGKSQVAFCHPWHVFSLAKDKKTQISIVMSGQFRTLAMFPKCMGPNFSSNDGAEGPWMPPHSAQLFEVHGDKLLHQNCQV